MFANLLSIVVINLASGIFFGVFFSEAEPKQQTTTTWPRGAWNRKGRKEVLALCDSMNRVKEVERINKADLALQLKSDTVGNSGTWNVDKSWHAQYKDSAYVYVGGLPYDLSEGDVIVIFSQFGEIVDVNLPRDRDTGKPKGFAFIAYEDQRSTILAVDNFNGAQVLGRTLRCDHCASFNEEQKKDANNLPDHVTRKLSEKELAKKKADIEQRNVELDEAGATKAGLFADGRGISESDRVREEREIRQSIVQAWRSPLEPTHPGRALCGQPFSPSSLRVATARSARRRRWLPTAVNTLTPSSRGVAVSTIARLPTRRGSSSSARSAGASVRKSASGSGRSTMRSGALAWQYRPREMRLRQRARLPTRRQRANLTG